MGVYAVSGILLIFRPTDILKYEQTQTRQYEANLSGVELLPLLKMRGSKVTSENADKVVLNYGEYDKDTGLATRRLPRSAHMIKTELETDFDTNVDASAFPTNKQERFSMTRFSVTALLAIAFLVTPTWADPAHPIPADLLVRAPPDPRGISLPGANFWYPKNATF